MQLFGLPSSQTRGKERILYTNSCKSLELLAPSCKHQQLSGPKVNYSYFSFNRPNFGALWSNLCIVLTQAFPRCSVSRLWVTFALWGRGDSASLHVVGGELATSQTVHKWLQLWSLALFTPFCRFPSSGDHSAPHRTGSAPVVMLQESFTCTGFQKHISELRILYFLKVQVEKCIFTFSKVVLC